MSAFIHSDSTYDRVYCTLLAYQKDWSHLAKILDGVENFVRELRDWNYKSVNYRYKEQTEIYKWTPVSNFKPYTPIECFKILQSIEYQTCEDPQWKDSKNFHRLLQMQILAAEKVLTHTPAYEQAAWS